MHKQSRVYSSKYFADMPFALIGPRTLTVTITRSIQTAGSPADSKPWIFALFLTR
jgi:hypothetical protein